MKITRLFWLIATALFVATSCEDIDTVKNISISCHTQGLKDGANSLPASWGAEEQIYLFRSEDWSAALMTQTSGAGTDTATFTGSSAGTKSGYYAIRPASAAGSIMPNGTLAVTVRPSNIFFAGEDISSVIPQVGKGDQDGVNFTSLFGALKFNLSGDYEVSKITVTDPGKDRGLYGTFGYNFTSGSIIDDEVFYEVARIPASPLALTSAPTIYVALPAGSYDKLELALRDSESGNTLLYVLKDVEVVRNSTKEVALPTPMVVSCVVGSWRLAQFCGADAEVDLYVDFSRDGKFTIYQRMGSPIYSKLVGTYSVNISEETISGVYGDGEAWADSYKFSLDSNGNLVLESVNNSGEVSVYEPAEMPSANKQSASRGATSSVKPL